MPRAGLTGSVVVDHAAHILDSDGSDALTMAALADRLGVRAPSLYKHVADLPDLRRRVGVRAKTELAQAAGAAVAGRSGEDAVRALASAYRTWALAHPGIYPATLIAADESDESDVAASQALVEVVDSALRAFDLQGTARIDAVRFLRSVLHGFIALETSGGFALPASTAESFDRAVDAAARAVADWR